MNSTINLQWTQLYISLKCDVITSLSMLREYISSITQTSNGLKAKPNILYAHDTSYVIRHVFYAVERPITIDVIINIQKYVYLSAFVARR